MSDVDCNVSSYPPSCFPENPIKVLRFRLHQLTLLPKKIVVSLRFPCSLHFFYAFATSNGNLISNSFQTYIYKIPISNNIEQNPLGKYQPKKRLNAEVRSFVTYISPTPAEHSLRLWTIEMIRRTLRSKWANAKVECFGSVGTGLYLPGGFVFLSFFSFCVILASVLCLILKVVAIFLLLVEMATRLYIFSTVLP